jgi:hypothetical protein
MSEYFKKTIEVCQELIIDIHYNPNISKKPYLCRVFGYDGLVDARLDSKELLRLSESLADCLFDKPDVKDYNDCFTEKDEN